MADSIVYDTNRNESFWISYIKGRIAKKKNFLVVLTGPVGSGKSWSALSICKQVDPTFNDQRIVTSMKQLMNLVNSGNLKSGQAILWDEAGIDISNRNWQSLVNRMVNFLLQTFRHQRLILIMTVPYMDFIDASTRKLFHAEFLTQSIDYELKVVKLKPQLIQYNSRTKKFYYKYLRVRTKLGVSPVKIWNITKPPQDLIDRYEEIKQKFTSNLNKDIGMQLNAEEYKTSRGNKIPPLTEKQKQAFDIISKYGSFQEAIRNQHEIPESTLYFHFKQGKKKGWTLENYSKGMENTDMDI